MITNILKEYIKVWSAWGIMVTIFAIIFTYIGLLIYPSILLAIGISLAIAAVLVLLKVI